MDASFPQGFRGLASPDALQSFFLSKCVATWSVVIGLMLAVSMCSGADHTRSSHQERRRQQSQRGCSGSVAGRGTRRRRCRVVVAAHCRADVLGSVQKAGGGGSEGGRVQEWHGLRTEAG